MDAEASRIGDRIGLVKKLMDFVLGLDIDFDKLSGLISGLIGLLTTVGIFSSPQVQSLSLVDEDDIRQAIAQVQSERVEAAGDATAQAIDWDKLAQLIRLLLEFIRGIRDGATPTS